MNLTCKKFISLLLVCSLMILSVNLYAKGWRGAKLIVTKKDGQQIKGELIAVKLNSLLLLDTEEKDISVDIEDIKVIRVVKKSKTLLGAGIGFLTLGGGGALLGAYSISEGLAAFILGLGGAAAGLLIGAITGALLGTDKTFQIEGMTDAEIQETLDYLRKKARI